MTGSVFDVYCHTSPSGKRYVGQSRKGLAARWREHVSEASQGSDTPLHRAIRKYGAGAFRAELLEQCDTQASAYAAERRWIAQRGTMAPAGYNATAGGEGFRGSVEARAKISQALTGRKKSDETVARMRIAAAARMTEEAREHLRSVNTGRRRSELARAKMRARTQSAETREKLRGRFTPEERARYSAMMKEIRSRRARREP